jgi:hypothetical protein
MTMILNTLVASLLSFHLDAINSLLGQGLLSQEKLFSVKEVYHEVKSKFFFTNAV